MDKEALYSLIGIRLQMLINLFGRKVSEDQLESMKRVYCEALERMSEAAISKGFSKAERTCDRFPTPKMMRELCVDFLSGPSVYNHRWANGEDPETKKPVRVKIDCETGDILYKAQDCPEGRAFLLKLRELAANRL